MSLKNEQTQPLKNEQPSPSPMALKNEVDVVGKLDALPIGHGEQPVVIQHTVQRLNPPACSI
jgi:hypothetical protein